MIRITLRDKHRSSAEGQDVTGNPGPPTRYGFRTVDGGFVGRRSLAPLRSAARMLAGMACLTSLAWAFGPHPHAWLRKLQSQGPSPIHGWQHLYPGPLRPRGVILYRDYDLRVKKNGHVRTRIRLAYRILSRNGSDLANYEYLTARNNRLRHFHGWEWAAGYPHWQRRRKHHALQLSPLIYYPGYVRYHIWRLQMPTPLPGAIVGFSLQARRRPRILQLHWPFQRGIPVLYTRLRLRLPRGWKFQAHWRHWPPQAPQFAGSQGWDWILRDVPGLPHQPRMPTPAQLRAWMTLTLIPPQPLPALTPQNWQAVGNWYEKIAAGRHQPDAAMRAAVARLTAGQASLAGKIRALARYVQMQIRYVAIEIGIGGYRPHPASLVWQHRYGDCKDKATLLMALLRVLGVQAHYVLLNHQAGIVAGKFPYIRNFDHAIVAISWPRGASLAEIYDSAQVAGLGTVVYFDPTADTTAWGWLPSSEQGGHVLLITHQHSYFLRLPQLPDNLNRRFRYGQLVMQGDGSLRGGWEEIRTGSYASRGKRRLHMSPRRRQYLRLRWSRVQSGIQVYGWHGDSHNGSMVLRFQMRVNPFLQIMNHSFYLRPWLAPFYLPAMEESEARAYPIRIGPKRLETDLCQIYMPRNLAPDLLPPAINIDLTPAGAAAPKYASYQSSYRWKITPRGPMLTVQRTLAIEARWLPASAYGDLQRFTRQVFTDQETVMAFHLVPVTTNTAQPPATGHAQR